MAGLENLGLCKSLACDSAPAASGGMRSSGSREAAGRECGLGHRLTKPPRLLTPATLLLITASKVRWRPVTGPHHPPLLS